MAAIAQCVRVAIRIRVLIPLISGIFPTHSWADNVLPEPGSAKPFRDCSAAQGCPAMVVVPGTDTPVTLGSPSAEAGRVDNEVEHARTIAAFAIGQTEVTVAEYRRCVEDGACQPPEWLEPGGEHNIETGRGLYYKNLGTALSDDGAPIVGVSFVDATAFSAWLAKKTGRNYRLPSEAEWEYAARAGTTTAYWWGDNADGADGQALANCRGCGEAERKLAPEPAISYAANAWGLYNVHGNVWEWAADYYCADQTTGPADGKPRPADDCAVRDAKGLRVLRGGSAFYDASKMRAASRLRNFPTFRNFSVGFRVARDL